MLAKYATTSLATECSVVSSVCGLYRAIYPEPRSWPPPYILLLMIGPAGWCRIHDIDTTFCYEDVVCAGGRNTDRDNGSATHMYVHVRTLNHTAKLRGLTNLVHVSCEQIPRDRLRRWPAPALSSGRWDDHWPPLAWHCAFFFFRAQRALRPEGCIGNNFGGWELFPAFHMHVSLSL